MRHSFPKHADWNGGASPYVQHGNTLLVAILLLLLAGVMTLLALNVGLFEQRTTSNDLRAKMTHEVGEAGLAQGFEFLFRQHQDWLTSTSKWESCSPTDTTFPCGAVPQFEPDGTTPRRSTMFRLKAYTNTISGIPSQMSQYMLPLGAVIAKVGNGETAAYGVAPLVCRAKRPDPADPVTTPVRCGDGTGSSATDLRIVTFVSSARLPGESSRTTLVQTLGTYPLLGDLVGKPPITTSGSADVTGGLQIVTNPNAAGSGVAVSIWTRKDVDKHGSPNTCFADEFFRYTQGSVTPTLVPSTCPSDNPDCQTTRCDDCRCDANGSPETLSYDNSGVDRCLTNSSDCEGIDILDVEGTSATNGTGTNYNVRSDSNSYPTCEFPPDMFKFIFGVAAWTDTNSDCFGDTKITASYTNPNTGISVGMGADEAWLFANANKIIPASDAAHTYSGVASTDIVKTSQNTTSAYLNSAASGIIWCQTGCDIGSGQEVGSPTAPVLLILDGPVSIQGRVWGMVMVRDPSTSLDPSTGSHSAGNCPSNCMLQMNAGAAIYGALVVQGQMKANGTAAVIYDGKVLHNLEETGGSKYASLPGAWNDRQAY